MDKPATPTVQAGKGKEFSGVVVAQPTPHTVIVEVVHVRRHPIYKKAIKHKKHLPAHFETESLPVGTMVVIRESKPISKTKHFIVIKKIESLSF